MNLNFTASVILLNLKFVNTSNDSLFNSCETISGRIFYPKMPGAPVNNIFLTNFHHSRQIHIDCVKEA